MKKLENLCDGPFKVINKGGKPIIQVEYRDENKEFVSRIIHFSTSDL